MVGFCSAAGWSGWCLCGWLAAGGELDCYRPQFLVYLHDEINLMAVCDAEMPSVEVSALGDAEL